MDDSLARFLDFTTRLTRSVRFAGVKLGVLYTMDETPEVLGLRAELVSEIDQGDVRRFHAGGVGAFSAVDPSLRAMESLVKQLADGHVREFVEVIHEQPRLLKAQTGSSWLYHDDLSWIRNTRAAFAQWQGDRLDRHFPPDKMRALDRNIAVQSDYRLSSFRRLAAEYLGQNIENHQLETYLLVARWPLQALRVEPRGRGLRIEIDALPGIDRDRLVLNLEAEEQDMPLAPNALKWTQVPGQGRVSHVGVTEELPITPVAVNAYYRGIDEVWLREQVPKAGSQERAPGQSSPGVTSRLASHLAPLPVTRATLSSLHVEYFRSLRNVSIQLTPLTVLVGPNQAGKSTLLDALDLLRSGASKELYGAIVRRRGGFSRIAWRGKDADSIRFDLQLRPESGPMLRYELVLGAVGADDYTVESERIYRQQGDGWQLGLDVHRGQAEILGNAVSAPDRRELFVAQVPAMPGSPEIETVRASLASMAVYPHLTTAAAWAGTEAAGMRAPTRPEPGARLLPTGANLVAALHSLREESPEQWELFLEITRRVFPDLEDVRLPPAVSGFVQLSWRDRRFPKPFDASELSDGTLAFLASLCALLQPGASLVAIDEPERHLHPEALYRLLGAARLQSHTHPVVLATQSDRLLGFLDDIPESVVVVRAGENGTDLVRPDPEAVQAWLKQFSLAEMRQELETWGEE